MPRRKAVPQHEAGRLRFAASIASSGPFGGRGGFTLLEVMLALTLSAGIILTGRLLLEQMAETGRAIVARSDAQDSVLAREEALRNLFRSVEVGTEDSVTFGGGEHAMKFWSWCDSAAGLRGRCTVTVTLDTTLTVLPSTTGLPVVLLRGRNPGVAGVFRYLADARNGGVWYRSWGSGVTAPLAVAVIFGNDTTVLRIGARG